MSSKRACQAYAPRQKRIVYQLEIKLRKLLALLNSQVCNVRFFKDHFQRNVRALKAILRRWRKMTLTTAGSGKQGIIQLFSGMSTLLQFFHLLIKILS